MTRTVETPTRRQKLAAAAAAIERIAAGDVSPDKFFRELLRHLVEATDAAAGAVWRLDENRVLSVLSDHRLAELEFDRQPDAHRLHVQYLLDVLQKSETSCRAAGDHALPVECTLLIVPIHHKDQSAGLLELFLGSEQPPDAVRETIDFVQDVTEIASRYLDWRAEAHSPNGQLEFWSQFERVVGELHGSLHSKEIAAVATNEGRSMLACDRFSVVTGQGRRMKTLSVSGQGRVNSRSNLIRSLVKLVKPVVKSNQPMLYDGQTTDFPPQIAAPLVEFLKESKARSVLVIPLAPPNREKQNSDRSGKKHPRAFGACLLEWFDRAGVSPLKRQQAEGFCRHVASALANARTHERVFLLPLRRFLGGILGWFRGRRFAAALAVLLLLEAAVVALVMTPARYRAEATGRLMPVAQRDVFAPWDGEIVEIYVESGQKVARGQQLLRLQNDELEQTLLALKNRLGEQLQLKELLKVQLGEIGSQSNRREEIQIRGKQAQNEIEIRGITLRITALEKQIESLVVRTPINGTVATFQLNQLLQNRPASRGEVLLQVMDESQNWRLELDLPEHRLGSVTDASNEGNNSALPVEFVLATAPEKKYTGTLVRTATRIQLSPDNEAVMPVLVDFERDDVPLRRIGAKVRAKIDCGERSLAYVLFGDVVEFVQRRFW